VGCGLVLGCRDRQQHLLQHRRLRRGEGEPAVHLAVAVVRHRQAAGLCRLGLLLLEEVGLVGVRQVRRHHLQQAPPTDRQRAGIMLGGGSHQVLFGPDEQVGVQAVGECLDGSDDHACLVYPQVTAREGVPDQVVGGQVVAEPHGAGRVRAGLPGLVGEPVRRRRGTDL
jgi:hypothetical protein